MSLGENIIPINIEDEMRGAYIDYSMSVIVSRALPDVRDGLKPVHRRVLFAMDELGVSWNKPHKKSARIVGEVLGKYHPHGDTAVYDSLVRMAQPWSLRYPLVDGQGNFGSIDGDSPAAMRYTEARLKRMAEELLTDINKNTVEFQSNFDDSLKEPTVLPAKIPNLLVNGSSGIAVGMATNMAPHNLGEVVDAIHAYIDNNDITIPELMKFVIAPDFPTGGIIYGYQGVKSALETGRGRVVMRAKTSFETTKTGKEQIIVTEIPYMVNKASMIEKTAQLVNEKKIEGISDIRDESDRDGLRIVYDLKRDAVSAVVLNNLFKYTALQSSFGVNNVALVKGRPLTLNLKDLIVYFVEHRHEIVIRRTEYELNEAEKRAHILQGYLIALDNLDAVIRLIRESRDRETAKLGLIAQFEMSEIQANAVLDLRLHRLTGLEHDKIVAEYNEVMALIADLKSILASEERRMTIIKDELTEIKDRYADKRRTEIVYVADDLTLEDMIADENVVITISHDGYIKRTQLVEYRSQGRGGVGAKGAGSKDTDFTEHLFIANTHSVLLIFSDKGKVYWLKVFEIPEGAKTAKGRPLQNLIQIDKDERVRAVININDIRNPDYVSNHYLIMCTTQGTIKKTSLEAYSRPRQSGIQAINIHDGDSLLDVKLTNGNDEIVIATRDGRAIRFNEAKVRPMGRTASGVKAISFDDENDTVIGIAAISDPENQMLLVVSEKGYGKRSDINDYRITNRGGKGVKTLNVSEKTGKLVSILQVVETDELMIINKSGLTIRMPITELRVIGRTAQGVRIIKLNENDEISSIAKIEKMDDLEVIDGEESVSDNFVSLDDTVSLDTLDTDDDLNTDEDLDSTEE